MSLSLARALGGRGGGEVRCVLPSFVIPTELIELPCKLCWIRCLSRVKILLSGADFWGWNCVNHASRKDEGKLVAGSRGNLERCVGVGMALSYSECGVVGGRPRIAENKEEEEEQAKLGALYDLCCAAEQCSCSCARLLLGSCVMDRQLQTVRKFVRR